MYLNKLLGEFNQTAYIRINLLLNTGWELSDDNMEGC